MKSGEMIALSAFLIIVIGVAMAVAGPQSTIGKAWNEALNASHQSISAPAPATGDYHSQARQDAINAGIDPDLYERQINQESSFNPSAQSPMGAEGIAQIMPSTAQAWNVDPWNASDALRVAAQHMAWYQNHYGSYAKALACYNAGTDALDKAIARYGDNWRIGLPSETQNYITVIMGA